MAGLGHRRSSKGYRVGEIPCLYRFVRIVTLYTTWVQAKHQNGDIVALPSTYIHLCPVSGFIDTACVGPCGPCIYLDKDNAKWYMFSPQHPLWCSSLVTSLQSPCPSAPSPQSFSASKIVSFQKCQIQGITHSFGNWLFPSAEFPGNSSGLFLHVFFIFIVGYPIVIAWFISSFTHQRQS